MLKQLLAQFKIWVGFINKRSTVEKLIVWFPIIRLGLLRGESQFVHGNEHIRV